MSLCRAPRRILLASGCHTPNRIPDVIGNQQGTGLVDGQPDRPSAGLFIRVQEAGDDVLGFAARTPAAERHENDLVAVEAWPVPTAMFADEGAAAVLLGKTVRRVESKPQRSDVRAQRIVGNNRLLDQIRTLPFLPPRFIAPERPVPHLSLPTPDRRRYQSANFNGCHLAAQWRSNVVWLGAAYAQACGAGCSSQDRNLRAMRGVYQNCTDWKCENETILLQPRPPRRS